MVVLQYIDIFLGQLDEVLAEIEAGAEGGEAVDKGFDGFGRERDGGFGVIEDGGEVGPEGEEVGMECWAREVCGFM